MAIHSGILDWKTPWTEQPGWLQSKGSQRVGHDWSDLAHAHTHHRRGMDSKPVWMEEIWRKVVGNTEKAMETHSSTLAWKIPRMEEPGRLQSMGSLGVGHECATLLSLFTFMHWRRKWRPTTVFLSGESQGQGRLVGCPLWGRTELDTTEVT